jgi:hypothetical protein
MVTEGHLIRQNMKGINVKFVNNISQIHEKKKL